METEVKMKVGARKESCTGIIVGKNLTTSGHTIFGRSEDLEVNHNKAMHLYEAGVYHMGDVLEDTSTVEGNGYRFVFEKDSYSYSAIRDTTPQYGIFDEAGFNEYGLMVDMTVSAIANTKVLRKDPYVDGSKKDVRAGLTEAILPTIVLSTCKDAREAVGFICKELAVNGAAEGNTFVIADQNELYYMEVYTGHQFACIRYPEDAFSVCPNTYFLEEICIKDFIEKDYTLESVDGDIIVSKDIINIARRAHSFYGDKNEKVISLAKSYRPCPVVENNTSRYVSGSCYLKNCHPEDIDVIEYPFLQTTNGKIEIEDVFAVLRNRMEHMNQKASDYKDGNYPIGNRHALEAHVFEVNKDLDQTMPGIMYVALGSPVVSPFVAYYPNQSKLIDEVKNETNSFALNSMYWLAMDTLHMLETNRTAFTKNVELYLSKVQPKLVRPCSNVSEEEANAFNAQDAKYAYNTLLELHNEMYQQYATNLNSENWISVFNSKKLPAFIGSRLIQPARTSTTHYHLGIEEVKHGYEIKAYDPYGEEVENFSKVLTIQIPKKALHDPYLYLENKKYSLRSKGDFYELTTMKLPLLVQEDHSDIPLVIGVGALLYSIFAIKKHD